MVVTMDALEAAAREAGERYRAKAETLHKARLAAAKTLGAGVRVVSMPCTQRFDRQSAEYRESVLPSACRKRVAVEAGVTDYWNAVRNGETQEQAEALGLDRILAAAASTSGLLSASCFACSAAEIGASRAR